VHEAREPRADQSQAEPERDGEVLAVGLADRLRVIHEAARQREAHRIERIGIRWPFSSQFYR